MTVFVTLQGMGFRSKVSEVALKEYKTVQAAIDAILAGKGELTYIHTCSIATTLFTDDVKILLPYYFYYPYTCVGNYAFHKQYKINILLPFLSSYNLIPKIT